MKIDSLYVISEDIDVLLDRWLYSICHRRFPAGFFDDIRRRLHQILHFQNHNVIKLTAQDLTSGMSAKLQYTTDPVISVDPVYCPTEHMLHVTRCVDSNLRSLPGIFPRFGHLSIDQQLDQIVASLQATSDSPVKVTLVDDVVFTGGVLSQIIEFLRKRYIYVNRVVSGVAVITDENDPFILLQSKGATLDAVAVFGQAQHVVDEICERDFFVPVAMCGRSFAGEKTNRGAPYIAPFGRPSDWASFGEHEHRLSQALIQLNIDLLNDIASVIGRPVQFRDIEREPNGVRRTDILSDEIAVHLASHLCR